jgi:exodeoxyribonuclease VII large subunit
MENRKPKPLPRIIQKIALITSENSAGHLDFKEILTCGTFELYPTTMNELYPHALTTGIIKQIEEINRTNNVDVICITRGGGSTLSDIFNDPELVSAIGASQIPILMGTGHAADHSLCDKVSDSPIEYGKKRYFITPTALAHFLNEYNNLQIAKADKRLIQIGGVADEISGATVLVYIFILYILYQTFWLKLSLT